MAKIRFWLDYGLERVKNPNLEKMMNSVGVSFLMIPAYSDLRLKLRMYHCVHNEKWSRIVLDPTPLERCKAARVFHVRVCVCLNVIVAFL